MKFQEVIDYFGSKAAISRAMRVTPGLISKWEDVPMLWQCYFEVLTEGKLKVDPDILAAGKPPRKKRISSIPIGKYLLTNTEKSETIPEIKIRVDL